jgi:hypothetical protein
MRYGVGNRTRNPRWDAPQPATVAHCLSHDCPKFAITLLASSRDSLTKHGGAPWGVVDAVRPDGAFASYGRKIGGVSMRCFSGNHGVRRNGLTDTNKDQPGRWEAIKQIPVRRRKLGSRLTVRKVVGANRDYNSLRTQLGQNTRREAFGIAGAGTTYARVERIPARIGEISHLGKAVSKHDSVNASLLAGQVVDRSCSHRRVSRHRMHSPMPVTYSQAHRRPNKQENQNQTHSHCWSPVGADITSWRVSA